VKDAFSEAGLRGAHGGSLTLYIQNKSPGADEEPNWQPPGLKRI